MPRVRTLNSKLILSALVFSLMIASSCGPSLKISLATSAERIPNPSFTVVDPDHQQQPQYDTVEVWDTTSGKEADKAKLVWKLVADPFGTKKGVAQLTYGKKIDGFKFDTDPLPLESGHQYRLRVVGSGEGNFHFRIGADGKLDQVN